ncbi:TetR/AcrR family transcriptional regulator [Phenylobacterium sp.]|uniref:TetR/AcrR family transcriptional regulator n=1 Tax=Phenylobacterium sp. TaxID=1871053 RepID=UPI0035B25F75
MSAEATRRQIVEAADDLFYRQGFDHTSFADIAQAVGLSRGNFYYHFKTKDEILGEVIALRLQTTQAMLDAWEAQGEDPAQRIASFIEMLIANRAQIMLHGCPVGTLCGELAKLDHAAQGRAAEVFSLFRTWLARQFALMGAGAEADRLAMHLLARSQGVAALASAFRDEAFIRQEVDQMHAWMAACAASQA